MEGNEAKHVPVDSGEISAEWFFNPISFLKRCSVRNCDNDVTHYIRIGGNSAQYANEVLTLACFCKEHKEQYAPIISAWWNRLYGPVLNREGGAK